MLAACERVGVCRLCLYLEGRLLHKKAGDSIQDAERYLTLYAAAADKVQDATTSVSTSVLAEPGYRLHASRLKLAINGWVGTVCCCSLMLCCQM